MADTSATPEPLTAAFLSEAAALVDGALDAWLPTEGTGAPRLAEAMRYSVFAGGKRLRPALALAACRAVEGRDEDVLPFACALELIHTYSLIHDDLPAMDDDDLRRGRPTSHKAFDEAHAILAGDALHTLAFDILLDRTNDKRLAALLALELARASGFEGMVGGQVEDLAGDGNKPQLERLRRIHEGKTASLIRAATRGGGLAGGADEPTLEALGTFGLSLGLAFQITDDVLDETSSADVLGKTPGKDRADDKMTYVALEGLEGAKRRAEAEKLAALQALRAVPSPGLLVGLAHFVTQRDR
jgi:geranylgeranyl diphosphate synthase type II